jgi:3'-phosphoadenosine 5'-phosphosulfate sulfotransferase (PAPS reductase)/FAD synthetase
MQFCTLELKINPALRWLDETDPAKEATILIGVRRAESSNRRDYPYFTESSPNHGGRPRVAPMADYSDDDRNELIIRAGWEPLPHRSKECYPCINSKKEDLLELEKDHERVEEVAAFESEMGFSAKGQPIRLFKPYRYMGATGIREMLKWAKSPRGKYLPPVDLDDGTGGANEDGCVSEWCGI